MYASGLKKRTQPAKSWPVNESPQKLDEFYVKLLGEGGDTMLSEEVRWLAITHKTFEQGARGYNDRLAFLGQSLLVLYI